MDPGLQPHRQRSRRPPGPTAQLCRPPGASGESKAPSYNAVGAQHTDGKVGNVHGATLALTIAGSTAKQLGHHAFDIGALGNAMAVAAVRASDVIRILQMCTNRHSHGFLTDVGMQGPHDFALAGLIFRLLLEEANAPHARIDGFESVCGWCLNRHWHILHVTVANTRGRAALNEAALRRRSRGEWA